MSFIDKMKESISNVIDSDVPLTKPDFIKEVLVIQGELEKYQTLLANAERSYAEGQIDTEDYESLRADRETKITSLKAKIMSWSREYLDLKNSLEKDLETLRNEKSEAEGKLEKIEKHFALQLITDQEYEGQKDILVLTIKQRAASLEKKQKFFDEIIVIAPYIEEKAI
jgi:GTPase involved in cell partitioning and DNA repair